jgi:hypothetical protein
LARAKSYRRSVFINCPFSADYKRIFEAILFAVYFCEFRPRSALEASDSSEIRLSRILRIIRESKFGIHDISNMELDADTKLPRFNMPFEFGLFLAAKSFGSDQQKNKVALIFDRERYRYQKSLSDLSGNDIVTHDGKPEKAIHEVRNWLNSFQPGDVSLPGGSHIFDQYRRFNRRLPSASKRIKLVAKELVYADICRSMERWIKDNT